MKKEMAMDDTMEPADSKKPDEFDIKDGAETLMKAEHIRHNKALMPHVTEHLKMRKAHINNIVGVKETMHNEGLGGGKTGLAKLKDKVSTDLQGLTPKKRLGY